MTSTTYAARRAQLETYFDRTAAEAWARLTSDAPVSRIRATVRAGRDAMRTELLSWLPADLSGRRLLDAGCGTGALAVEAARRGAEVVAVDVSPTLVGLARERHAGLRLTGRLDFRVGDMLDDDLGRFDHVVAMDSLIHYRTPDIVRALNLLGRRTGTSLLFTVAPRTPLLTAMHAAGGCFPAATGPRRSSRSGSAPCAGASARAGPRALRPRTQPAHHLRLLPLQRPGAGAPMSSTRRLAGPWPNSARAICRSRTPPRRSCRSAGCCGCRCSRSRSGWRRCC